MKALQRRLPQIPFSSVPLWKGGQTQSSPSEIFLSSELVFNDLDSTNGIYGHILDVRFKSVLRKIFHTDISTFENYLCPNSIELIPYCFSNAG